MINQNKQTTMISWNKNIFKWLTISTVFILIFFLPFVLYIFLTEYINDRCTIKLGYEIESTLFEDIFLNGQDYFSLIEKAIDKDSIALRSLSIAIMRDGKFIQHSIIMVDIIQYVGEDYYCKVINKATYEERQIICEMLYTGCEFSSNTDVKSVFPKLYYQLNMCK